MKMRNVLNNRNLSCPSDRERRIAVRLHQTPRRPLSVKSTCTLIVIGASNSKEGGQTIFSNDFPL